MNEFLMIGACLFWIFMISPELDRLFLNKYEYRWIILQGTGDFLFGLFLIWQVLRFLLFFHGLLCQ